MTTDLTSATQLIIGIIVSIFALSMWMTARRMGRN